MYLSDKRPEFRPARPTSDPYRMMIWIVLIIGGILLFRAVNIGQIQPLFSPTLTPTRTAQSFALEGETHFIAGDLNKSIAAYNNATRLDPNNGELWSELARIQTYSSNLLTTDKDRQKRLAEALQSADTASKVSPDISNVWAIRAFVLDWNANNPLNIEFKDSYMTESEQNAVRALQLDNQNILALAYYAEILVDQLKWDQSLQTITQAVSRSNERNEQIMDVHRVNAYVNESLGNYDIAINEYKEALKITPNLTFLHLSVGLNYRQLKQYDRAIEYFAQAATINESLGVRDSLPYLAIGKTYTQMGEFFIAARNVKKAIQYDPTSPDVYGQLGIVYFKSHNYEGSIDPLKCAIYGCDADVSCTIRECDPEKDEKITIQGMPLSPNTVVYYYTYGSVLAGLHRKSQPYCDEAVKVLHKVRQGFPEDQTILSIVQASEDICASYGIVYSGG
ncbi:MAG: tetratricopeptide repeat protein [Leptolinea sp.]|jgi:tetratricopeptide (TPR) repeat protein|nr:tetratricopeptide repeat protein [Leptolinea sp.]